MTPNDLEIKGLMFHVLAERDNIGRLASSLNGRTPGIFSEVSLAMPVISPAELGLIRVVSWLYVLYYEAGRIGTKFLAERLGTYAPDLTNVEQHLHLVGELRTYLQHNLDASKPRDWLIQSSCETWFYEHCGSRIPGSEDHWQRCLAALLTEAANFLKALVRVLRGIESDESRDAIVNEWLSALDRYHPPHEFDQLIVVVCREMGRDYIKPVELRQRFYSKWVKELQLMNADYEFDIEARKLIEHALLTGVIPVLPITGSDIIRHFGISPGPQVGRLLELGRKLYDERPCSAEALLGRIEDARGES